MNAIFYIILLALVIIPVVVECIKTNTKHKLVVIVIYFNLIIISFLEKLSINRNLLMAALWINLIFTIRFIYVEYNATYKNKK